MDYHLNALPFCLLYLFVTLLLMSMVWSRGFDLAPWWLEPVFVPCMMAFWYIIFYGFSLYKSFITDYPLRHLQERPYTRASVFKAIKDSFNVGADAYGKKENFNKIVVPFVQKIYGEDNTKFCSAKDKLLLVTFPLFVLAQYAFFLSPIGNSVFSSFIYKNELAISPWPLQNSRILLWAALMNMGFATWTMFFAGIKRWDIGLDDLVRRVKVEVERGEKGKYGAEQERRLEFWVEELVMHRQDWMISKCQKKA
ncbi:hypothetical protein B0J14DRAFT_593147 [Halenospora varia]|nr:hypothetical protein B0J14DRAFT_593147 [Halenospora varia]